MSKSEINSIESVPDSSYNNWNKKSEQEEMNFQEENENTIIYRVWVVKRSVSENQGHIKLQDLDILPSYEKVFNSFGLLEPKHNVFNINEEIKSNFKHWALILELSNGSYVNIQYGVTGLSLKEFNRTNIPGENVLNAILDTWGEDGHPFSFCFLRYANYRYEDLKNYLEPLKNQEIQNHHENGKNYYNVAFYNCQHFVKNTEFILFGYTIPIHFFNYYLKKFFTKFFPNVNINLLKKIHEENLNKENEKNLNKNMDKIDIRGKIIENEIKGEIDKKLFEGKIIWLKNKVQEIYSKINFNS